MRSDGETEGAHRPQHETAGAPASAPGLRLSSDLPRPGARVGGLEVLGEIGRGAFGVVLRARDPALGRDVAIKLLLDRGSPKQLQRFHREGQLLASLDAPGILCVHGAGVADGRPYLVVELVAQARELDVFARPLPLAARVALVRDAARALGHAHARGIVHRDVKPANLLVDGEGCLRVADFGLAVAADVERLTISGAVLGTLAYMAPEQVIGQREAVGPATDVWALGAVLYELACGPPPFDGVTQGEVMRRIALATPEAPRSVAPEVSPALERVILRALAQAPSDRFPDGEALAVALDEVLAGRGAQSAGSRRRLLVGLPAAAVVVLGAVAAFYRPGEHTLQGPPRPGPAPQRLLASSSDTEAPTSREADALRERATAGDVRAMRELGRLLVLDGRRGCCREAAGWFERAGQHGDVASARELGLLLLAGRADVPRAQTRALAWLRRAADGPDPPAMTALFDAIDHLSPEELEEATRTYLSHHVAGHAWPENDPAVCGLLLAARDGAGDMTLAVPSLTVHCDSAVARLQLAELVAAGRHDDAGIGAVIEKDLLEGKVAWSERAEELLDRIESTRAQVGTIGQPPFGRSERLGQAREQAAAGAHLERLRLLEEAAALGSSEAMFLLVRDVLDEDPLSGRVLTLLRRSAALGYPRACEELGQLLYRGGRVPRDLPRAVTYLRRVVAVAGPAATAEDRGKLALALLEASGGRDPEGRTLLDQAARDGDETSVLELAERLVDGRYPRDLTYAFSLIDGRTFAPHNAPRVEALRLALRDLVHAPGQVGGPPR